jgi:ribosomal protein S8
MKASPFSSKIARAIKVLNFDYNDLDEEIIQLMCNENYIQNFNKENDQLEYLRDIYDEAAVKLKVKNI